MGMTIEKILSELTIKTAKHFNLDKEDAIAVVAQSRVANNLIQHGSSIKSSVDDLCLELYEEIANGE